MLFKSFLLILTDFSFWMGGGGGGGDWGLGYHSMEFSDFAGVFEFPGTYARTYPTRTYRYFQFEYTMFISNNRASFHLW